MARPALTRPAPVRPDFKEGLCLARFARLHLPRSWPSCPSFPLGADGAIKFTDVKLKNGLRVIVSEDHTAPTVSIAVTYNVGSADEKARRTGFAHLFEHMMFKGPRTSGPASTSRSIFNNGGNMNGTTNEDRTLYFETLPANQLELALFLESDRMKSLDINKANLDNQRNAVQEERRLGVDNQPYGKTFERDRRAGLRQPRLQALGDRLDGRPQRRVGGRRGDVLQDLLRAEQRRAVDRRRRRHQEDDGAHREVLRDDRPAAAAEAAGSRRAGAHAPSAAARSRIRWRGWPQVDIAWVTPPAGTPDFDALDVVSWVLSSGRSAAPQPGRRAREAARGHRRRRQPGQARPRACSRSARRSRRASRPPTSRRRCSRKSRR